MSAWIANTSGNQMKVNLLGFTFQLASLLWRYGHEAHVDCINSDYFDVTIIGGLWHLEKAPKDKPCIALALGSDVYRDTLHLDLLMNVDLTLIAHDAMRDHLKYIANKIRVWKMPFDSQSFIYYTFRNPFYIPVTPKRDTLLYCSSFNHQDFNAIVEYIEDNPLKKITILGPAYQDYVGTKHDNVLSIRHVPHGCMPYIYKMHREYRLYYKREVDLASIMTCEALYMGLKAYSNDVEVKEIPSHRFENVAIPQLIKHMESIL